MGLLLFQSCLLGLAGQEKRKAMLWCNEVWVLTFPKTMREGRT